MGTAFFWLGELLPESRRTFVPAADLSWGDVAVTSPHMIQIQLRKSKCDQVGERADIVVSITGTELLPGHGHGHSQVH